MQITNEGDISLPLAVWLLSDDYDFIEGIDNYISVTTLMKPVRQIVLPRRIPQEQQTTDVADYISRKLGHAIHDSIEKAWTNPNQYQRALRMMGYPDELIGRVAINPTLEEVRASNSLIPVYLEQRAMRQFEGFTIGGKFDMVTEGIVNDTKSTSAWSWVMGTRDDQYRLQMSLYRWIDHTQEHRKIFEDFGKVNFVFTDWQKGEAKRNPNYPQKRVCTKTIPLMSLQETEAWIKLKLGLINQNWHTQEHQLPHCTSEELWMSAPKYKYFADASKANQPGARSTKNFDDLVEARKFQASKGGVGTIVTVPGEAKACGYCAAFDGCTQKDLYL
jgi:hypothetical protein